MAGATILDRLAVLQRAATRPWSFGRRGARPFNKTEMEKFYLRNGQPYTVEDVIMNNGQLQTRSGQALKPGQQFNPLDQPMTAKPASRERLVRRGQ